MKIFEGKKFIRAKAPLSMSINSILMMSFSLLLLLVVGALSVGQYYLLNKSYAEQVRNEQVSLSKEIYGAIEDFQRIPNFSTDAGQSLLVNSYILEKINSSASSIYILTEDGSVLYPYYASSDGYTTEADFSSEIESIKSRIEKYTDHKSGDAIGYQSGTDYCTVTVMNFAGTQVYLYVSSSVSIGNRVRIAMITQIVFVSLIVFVLSFLVVSLISSRISSPIAEIGKKAKRMGKGNFDVDFATGFDSCKEISELSTSLNNTRDELAKTDRMQREFIANVTHDFKTPLAMIKAYASMIQEISGDNPEKRNKHCQVIIDESDRLAALVNDVLDISKINSGVDTLKPCVFNLSEYTEMIADRFVYLEETQGYTIDTDVAPDLYTEADKEKIGQVLYNLIGNAVNYTGEDKKIKIGLMEDNGFIRFDVTDTGSGIKSEEISTIWDRYYRSAEAHKRPIKGTGLGLSIVKTILTKHNFNFGILSEVGKGSTFYVEFPARTVWNLEDRGKEDKDEEG